ncbi:hypothetical protein HK100_007968, partial [Physocladia obscura]
MKTADCKAKTAKLARTAKFLTIKSVQISLSDIDQSDISKFDISDVESNGIDSDVEIDGVNNKLEADMELEVIESDYSLLTPIEWLGSLSVAEKMYSSTIIEKLKQLGVTHMTKHKYLENLSKYDEIAAFIRKSAVSYIMSHIFDFPVVLDANDNLVDHKKWFKMMCFPRTGYGDNAILKAIADVYNVYKVFVCTKFPTPQIIAPKGLPSHEMSIIQLARIGENYYNSATIQNIPDQQNCVLYLTNGLFYIGTYSYNSRTVIFDWDSSSKFVPQSKFSKMQPLSLLTTGCTVIVSSNDHEIKE